MFKKTKVRQILDLLQKDLSGREISRILGVSRNSVARIRDGCTASGKNWDELLSMDDDALYHLFYPGKFKHEWHYAPVDYSYVHKELRKTGVTEMLLWEEYCARCEKEGVPHCSYATFTNGYKRYTADRNYTSHVEHRPGVTLEVDWSGATMAYLDRDKGTRETAYLFVAAFPYSQYTYVEAVSSMTQPDWLNCNIHMLEFFGGVPVRIVCDNLKAGVITHPKHGEIVLNEAYLSFAEHYQVAIMPAAVKKPKQKASVEGAVGKIAGRIIGMLRNETYHSLEGLNDGIRKALRRLNEKPFQKREGSRAIIFETEEKPALKQLPLLPFEICEWSYKHKVGPDSHVWFEKGRYSVPSDFLGKSVDVKYTQSRVDLYCAGKLIASHKRLPAGLKNGKRTDESHLPYPLYSPATVESTSKQAEEAGPNTKTVIDRLYANAKVKEQAVLDAESVLDIAAVYGAEVLEEACARTLKDFYLISYNTLMPYVKELVKKKHVKAENTSGQSSPKGIIRGAAYYGKDGTGK